ncbi:prion-like-(Q/N-rich) domain-bearing protein 25 [Mercenaria mercenaria]|uniref:prion-like-(Q/N-rich) domain-bearing protein 25 n=1 Tax=Mercenaria mercenaria TaxID=6596 RepID=UPI00234F6E44|nr:prion-like-(Q/N-rich) domain-bearing protein 25 [Mercenaria mercenaria]
MAKTREKIQQGKPHSQNAAIHTDKRYNRSISPLRTSLEPASPIICSCYEIVLKEAADWFTNISLILIFLLVTIPGYCAAAVVETACPNGNTDCKADNSECDLADTPKCKCSNGFKQNPKDDTKCIAVLTGACSTNTDCIGTVTNSECSSSTCSCVAGYKAESNLCKKVLTGACSTDADCTGTVTNSECSSSTCSCVAGYKAESNLCAKVLSGTCSTNADCSGTVANSECISSSCSCVAGYKAENNLCTKGWMCHFHQGRRTSLVFTPCFF